MTTDDHRDDRPEVPLDAAASAPPTERDAPEAAPAAAAEPAPPETAAMEKPPARAGRGLFARLMRRRGGPGERVSTSTAPEVGAGSAPEPEVELRPARAVIPQADAASSPEPAQYVEPPEAGRPLPRPVATDLVPAGADSVAAPAAEEAPAAFQPSRLAVAATAQPEPAPALPPAPSIRRPVPLTAQMVVVTLLATVVTMTFVLVEPSPRWWLILGAAAVMFGMDGVLRSAWREPFASGQETAPYLFLPALYMLSVPVLIEHNARGEWALLLGLLGGLGFGAVVWGEVASVRPAAPEYPRARLLTTALAYFGAFAFFSLTYVFQIGLLPAMVAVGLAATMLAVELLREGEIDPLETLGFALVSGLVVAEGRWLIHYLPLDRYMAGLALLIVFYLVTGIVHSYITRQFTPRLALETTALATAALALVALARAGGLA